MALFGVPSAGFPAPAMAAEPIEQQGPEDKALVAFKAFMADKGVGWFQF